MFLAGLIFAKTYPGSRFGSIFNKLIQDPDSVNCKTNPGYESIFNKAKPGSGSIFVTTYL